LKTRNEIKEFIHSKGLVSVLGGNELPSTISAVLGEPWKPSAKGFTGWLDWWSLKIEGQRINRVFGEIERSEDILSSRLFKRTKTFVSNKLWPILDVIVRRQKELVVRGRLLSPFEQRTLTTIETEGPIRTDVLRRELKLEGKTNNSRFHRSLASLESYSLIVGAEDPKPEKHLHANIWQTWETRTGRVPSAHLSYPEAVEELLLKTLDACVLADGDQISKWFGWSQDTEVAEKELLNKKVISLVDSYVLRNETIERLSRLS
jgi:hypothetical protein